MRWLERLEDRLHWLAIPGLFRFLALTGVVTFAAQWIYPDIAGALAFDLRKILAGEVWRIVTFVFSPQGIFGFNAIGALFLYFAVMIAFLINDSLEQLWGSTRLTLFILTGWFGLIIGQTILGLFLPVSFPDAGLYLYLTTFFAFATYFPKVEFYIFFIIPIQVRWLAWIGFVFLAYSALTSYIAALMIVPALMPYALWVLPGFVRNRKNLAYAASRRKNFEAKQIPEQEAFHRCATCNRTEHDSPDLEFRTFPDGTEYCLDHLPADTARPS